MSKRPGKNKENLEATHQAFIDAAMEEFVECGFAEASTNRIVEKTGMARGSLYYHFGDKIGLFKAVYQEVMMEAQAQIEAKIQSCDSARDRLETACQAYLDLCADHDFRTITLVEVHGVLSLKDRNELRSKTLVGLMVDLVEDFKVEAKLSPPIGQTLYVFLYGTLGEMGRLMEFSSDIKRDRKRYKQAILLFIDKIAF